MTELDLYKWANSEHGVEWRWDYNREEKKDDVVVWVHPSWVEEFYKMLDPYLLDEGGLEARICSGGISLWMDQVCSPFNIDLEKVFPKEK